MTDALDTPALELRLEHHAKGARRIPAEPLFSLPADEVRALIAVVKERDELQRELHTQFDTSLHHETNAEILRLELASLRASLKQAESALNEIASMNKFTSSTGTEENKAVTIGAGFVCRHPRRKSR